MFLRFFGVVIFDYVKFLLIMDGGCVFFVVSCFFYVYIGVVLKEGLMGNVIFFLG